MNYYIVPSFLASFYNEGRYCFLFVLSQTENKLDMSNSLASYLLTELDISSYNYFKFWKWLT